MQQSHIHIAQAERMLGLRPTRLEQAYRRGRLEGKRRGGLVYVRLEDCRAYLRAAAGRGRKATPAAPLSA